MIRHKELDNGFKYIEIQNAHAEAKIALQGAHLFHYKGKAEPSLLWVSDEAYFEEGKAIRGGIPICFPWFGKNKEDATLAQHGFARTQLWALVLEEETNDGSHIRLQLKENADTLKQWPYQFNVYLDITISKTLTIALSVTNTDTKPFEISTALHTYFSVANIANVKVKGLDAKVYYDALKDATYTQKGDVVIAEEVDRVYMHPSNTIELIDDTKKITLEQVGSNSLVVWNPWVEKSKQMADMSDDGYKTMVCLETSNAREDARVVQVDETHVLKAIISQNITK